MKKRVCKIAALMVATSLLMTGCSNPLDKFKKNDEPTMETETVEQPNVSVTNVKEYNVGDTVLPADLVSYGDDVAVTNVAILGTDGSLLDSLDTSAAGEFTVNIVVEMADSNNFTTEYTYTVAGVPADKEAEEIYQKSKSKFILTGKNNTSLTITVDGDGDYISEYNYTEDPETGSFSISTESDKEANAASVTLSDGYGLALAPSSTEYNVDDALQLITGMFSIAADDASDEDKQYFEYITTFLQNMVEDAGSTSDGTMLYSLDGTQSVLNKSMIKIKYSYLTGNAEDDKVIPVGYSIVNTSEDGAKEIYNVSITYPTDISHGIDNVADIINVPMTISEDEEEEVPTFDDYDAFLESVKESFDISTVTVNDTTDKDTELILNHVLAGAMSDVMRDDNMDEGFDTDNTDGTNTEVVEESIEEEPTESGVVGKAKPTYQSKYPDLYKWPESDTKYRRWCYVVHDDNTYTNSVINPDGTFAESGKDEVMSGADSGSSGNNNTVSNAGEYNNTVSLALVSTTGTYYVSNANRSDVTMDTAGSNNSVAKFTYNGNVYYIESAKATTITNYQKSCIYNTNDMADGNYEIKDNAAKAETTTIGKITPYTISYRDTKGNNQTKGYMAVYNINNEYLVIYSDNMDSDTSNMVSLLKDLVTK